MLAEFFGRLGALSPGLKRSLWRTWYELLAARFSQADWTFMNYGFADLEAGGGLELSAGGMVDIPIEAAHRISNPGDQPLVFIEVQRGDYLGEDDIVRLSDDFGRVPARG